MMKFKDDLTRLFRPSFRLKAIVVITALLFCVDPSNSPAAGPAVTTSITGNSVTGNVSTQVVPPQPGGNLYGIRGGQTVGTNLFHSFSQFNVGPGDIAQFQTSNLQQNAAIGNILGRINGQQSPSQIFGTIDSATYYPSANLFLMNPYGFLFGANATVNVGGMVAFTSADYLRLQGVGGNGIFYADAAQTSILTSVPVAAFGFLGSNQGAISIQGSQLSVTPGQSISLVGGNIIVQSGTPDGGAPQPARLLAPNGKVQLASAASPGEFDAATLQALPNVNGASFTSFASVSMAPGSNINVSGANTVSIRGGQFILSVNDAVLSTADSVGAPETISLSPGSSIISSNAGPDAGADVMLTASSIQMDGASVQSLTTGDGPGGNITINAGNVNLASGSTIISESDGTAPGGNILVQATNGVTLQDSSLIFSLTTGDGPGGNITINADNVNLTSGGTIASESDGTASAGNILVQATNVTLQDGGSIFNVATGDGDSGNINISVSESLSLTQTSPAEALPTITSQAFTSKAGDITIQAGKNVTLAGGAIQSSADDGSTGLISITAQGTISLNGVQSLVDNSITGSGSNGGIAIQAGQFLITEPALTGLPQIGTETFSQSGGNISIHATDSATIIAGRIRTFSTLAEAGSLEISAPSITIDQGSSLSTRSAGPGNAGDLTLIATAGNLTLAGGSHVRTSSEQGGGKAGTMTATAADSILLSGGSTIESTSFRSGPAGLMIVTAQNLLSLTGGGTGLFSEAQGTGNGVGVTVQANQVHITDGAIVSARTTGAGTGGDINIAASQSVSLNNGGSISASSTGTADAGSINLTALNGLSMQNSSITTEAGQGAGGGNIKITTSPAATVFLQNSMISASVADGPGGGGNISIDPQFVILLNSQILAKAAQGQGGNIFITTNLLLPDATSVINADSGSGQNGTITIQSPIAPASGRILPLPQKPLIATTLLSQRCAALAGGNYSSFTVAGRDSLPAEPSGWLSSPLALATLSAGTEREVRGEGQGERREAGGEGETPILSLRQIAPPGFLTQAFAADWPAGCAS